MPEAPRTEDLAVARVAANARARALSAKLTALQPETDLYGLVQEAMAEGIIIRDRSGTVLDANEEAARLYGASLDELIGQRSTRLVEYLNRDGSRADLEALPSFAAFRTGEAQRNYLFGLRRRDGSIVWARANAAPFWSTPTTPLESMRTVELVIMTWTDVTDLVEQERADAYRRRLDAALGEFASRAGEATDPSGMYAMAVRTIVETLSLDVVNAVEATVDGQLVRRAIATSREGTVEVFPDALLRGTTDNPPDSLRYLLAAKEPVIFNDLRRGVPFEMQRVLESGGRSAIGTSVRSGGRTFGTIAAVSNHENAFGPEEARFVSGIADALGRVVERARAQDAIRRSEDRLSSIVANSSDVIAVVGSDGLVRFVTPSLERVSGYRPDELLGRALTSILEVSEATRLALSLPPPGDEYVSVEARLRHRDGSWREIEAVVSGLGDSAQDAGAIVVNVRDITGRKELERQLTRQAFEDTMTGLPNRALFLNRLQHAVASSRRADDGLAVVYIDVDGLKAINDSLGHEAGDEVLVEVGRRLGTNVRPGDTVARLGGDEFTVLAEHVSSGTEAAALAARLTQAFQNPFHLRRGQTVYAGISAGVALSTNGPTTAEALMRDADLALYRAKAEGRGSWILYDEALARDLVWRRELELELQGVAGRGELRVHYQPVLDLRTGSLSGLEALVRWESPTRGLVSPDQFIPVAEATGEIVPIGRWVLAEACRGALHYALMHPGAPSMVMSVNLSAREFRLADLVERVQATLIETGLDPTRLQLEITETALLPDLASARRIVDELRALGVRIALDDFGTGYASLSYVQGLPIDALKIDRSFVARLEHDIRSQAIVGAVVTLAASLGIRVTAEGVETREQLALLRSLDVGEAQGYLFLPPVPAAELPAPDQIVRAALTHLPAAA